LLFSQTELWSHTGHPLPFAAVFVHGPQGVAFGWVGRARAVLLVNGEPHDPQWVIVRDESGQEAISASLPSDAHVLLTLEYWPTGETGGPAPASIDAEFGSPASETASRAVADELADEDEDAEPDDGLRRTSAESFAEPAEPELPLAAPPARAVLPTQQPGLAPDPTGMRFAGSEGSQSLPSTRHPSSGTFAMPQVPGKAASEPPSELNERRVASEHDDAENLESAGGEPGHPVGRWLQKLMGFGRKRDDAAMEEDVRPPLRPARPAVAAAPAKPLRPPALHAPAAPHIEPEALAPPPLPAAEFDREEPHALPPAPLVSSAAAPRPPVLPQSAPPPAPTPSVPLHGLAAAGMSEILGGRKPASAVPAATTPAKPGGVPRLEGLTAMSSQGPVAPPPPPSRDVEPRTPPAAPPYPVLDVKPKPAPGGVRGPMQIDREPVGADTGFAIPKLPPRGGAPPVRPPAITPPTGPQPTASPAGSASSPPRPTPQPPPNLSTPSPRESDVPEPPTEFLERFAASMRVAPGLEPTPQEDVAPRRETPPPAASPPHAAGPTPPAVAPPRTGGPPPLPSARRAAAQTQRPVFPATPAAPQEARASASPTPAAGTGHVSAPRRESTIPSLPAEAATPMPSPVPSMPAPAWMVESAPSPVLRSPSESAPVPVVESEVSEQMRELPLGGAAREMPGEVPDGVLVAQPSRPRPAGARPRFARRGEWPDLDELEQGPRPLWRRPWVIGTFVTVMLGIGWIVGHSQAPDNDVHATPMTRLLRTVGLGGARFTADIDTDPPGAWIAIDGRDLGRRTPSTLELMPGVYALTLSMPDLGEVKLDLKGGRGQKIKVNEALHGSLDVVASDPSLPVQMSLDGAPQGYLPVHVAKLPPGLHELQFSGPRMQPWAQNVNVGIRKNTKVVSKPMLSPATGVVQVLAQMNDENGSAPLSGASVYVDGDLRGTSPATIELPRGPHSLRVQFEGVVAPIQVIDLPGGNKRFATFQFGLDSDLPPLKLDGDTKKLLSKKPAVVSAGLDGLDADDLREAWLHVLTPDGLWSRFEMTIESGARGAVLTVNFPVSQFNGEEKATWYLSAATKQGDEFFTEVQRSTR
jgi:hypothetical protein